MLHKSVPVERLEEDEELYSIYLGMEGMDDDEEKKMHLTRLYMKWNPVSTNFDPMKSGRAKSLLGLIKAFRAKLEK